jgi:hypothetical protein
MLMFVDRLLCSLFKDKKKLIDELDTVTSRCTERDRECARLQEYIERMQNDKTKLSRRVSKLVLNGKHTTRMCVERRPIDFNLEKELIEELKKCRRTTKAPTPTATGKKLSLSARVDLHLKNVEDERDMYRNEMDILQKLLNERTHTANTMNVRARSLSPSIVRRDTGTSPVSHLTRRSPSNGHRSPTRCTVCNNNRHRSTGNNEIPFDGELNRCKAMSNVRRVARVR